MAERCKFEGYLLYAMLLTGWVYPVVVHCALPLLLHALLAAALQRFNDRVCLHCYSDPAYVAWHPLSPG